MEDTFIYTGVDGNICFNCIGEPYFLKDWVATGGCASDLDWQYGLESFKKWHSQQILREEIKQEIDDYIKQFGGNINEI